MTELEPIKNEFGDLAARIEAILFVASSPVTAIQISEALTFPLSQVEKALIVLGEKFEKGGGISLQLYSGKYQLTTTAKYAADIERFLGLETTTRLTRAAVETMTIIAYRQPITRPGIDMIRGVSSDGVIKSLLSRGLIQEVGRADGPGRPILFSTTVDFLQHFGLNTLDQLPAYETEEVPEEKQSNGLLKD